ncbi:hypothetical protein [Simonsiella muelleri]|uniref:hypothetical protein n=1 Tax=Simonsiella muelleri TaxID=72 RepID=UPI0023EFA023|nr:hypothetical protein [Simonsiella muelleri]
MLTLLILNVEMLIVLGVFLFRQFRQPPRRRFVKPRRQAINPPIRHLLPDKKG